MVASDYDKSVKFKEGLYYDLQVLIVPQREWVFAALVEKTKISEEVKHTEYEMRDWERDQVKLKRDLGLSNSVQHPKKRATFDRPPRIEVPTALNKIQLCNNLKVPSG